MPDRLEQLLELHQSDPTDPFLTYGLAFEYIKAGRFDQAIEYLDRTIQLDEHYHYAYYQKGKILHQQGRQAEAVSTLQVGLAKAKKADDQKASAELDTLLNTIS